MTSIINGVISHEFPADTGAVIVNGVLYQWNTAAEVGWSGNVNTITSIASINGILVANISKVNEIT